MTKKSPVLVKEEYRLTPRTVDVISQRTADTLKETKLSSKDILRFRFSVEEVLESWRSRLGEDTVCVFNVVRRFGQTRITLSAEGKKIDPQEADNDAEMPGLVNSSSMLQTLGMSVAYRYVDGVNQVTIAPPTSSTQKHLPSILAFILAIVIGAIIEKISPSTGDLLTKLLIEPIFKTLMNLLCVIAGPLVFLEVVSGVYGIGDIAIMGSIGKKLLGKFLLGTYTFAALAAVICSFFVPIHLGVQTVGNSAFSRILAMLLNIVPHDIVTPFQDGNMLQIIFLAIATGLGILILCKETNVLTQVVDQLHSVVHMLMNAVGKIMPLFIFVSILNLIFAENYKNIGSISALIAVIIGIYCLGMCIFLFRVKTNLKMSVRLFVKKILPTFFVAFSTGSSTAAFGINLETCVKRLGISEKFVNFGIPFGEMLFKPVGAVEYVTVAMFTATIYNVPITPVWILTAVIVGGILAIAAPPIPGGASTVFAIMCLQLGIPANGLALAISVDLIVDYFTTGFAMSYLQSEVTIIANKLNMVDKKTLKSDN